MPRMKEFDPDQALDAAMRVFWEKGYQGTSAQDLCDGTGLGRSSIYATFASKRGLYERALRRYDELMAERQEALLADGGVPLRDRLRALLAAVVDDELGDGPRGCFAVNAAVEFGGRDPVVTALVERSFARMRQALRTAIAGASGGGDPAVLADYVHASMNGLRVMSRTVRDRRRLMAVADTVVDAVAPPA
ncbi:MAG TPA: TetR/AcrR family transcriptional regulator [Streptosporangiaceae bacterium]|jgi:TetR/AcrR family transcriptional repressor of nem operon